MKAFFWLHDFFIVFSFPFFFCAHAQKKFQPASKNFFFSKKKEKGMWSKGVEQFREMLSSHKEDSPHETFSSQPPPPPSEKGIDDFFSQFTYKKPSKTGNETSEKESKKRKKTFEMEERKRPAKKHKKDKEKHNQRTREEVETKLKDAFQFPPVGDAKGEDDIWDILLKEDIKRVSEMNESDLFLDLKKKWETFIAPKQKSATADELAYIGMIVQVMLNLTRLENANKVQLAVDSAEGAVWPFLTFLADHPSKLVVREREPQGDFHLRIGEKDTVFVVERKALRDLSSGKKTERFAEQRARLLTSGFPRNQMLYIFEHEPHICTVANLQGQQWLLSWNEILNTESKMRHRDGMQALSTPHLLATLLLLLKDLEVLIHCSSDLLTFDLEASSNSNGDEPQKRLRLYNPCPTCQPADSKMQANQSASQYSRTLRVKKVDKLTPEIFLQKSLMQVPRMSPEAAICIVEEFGSMSNLMKAFAESRHPEQLLQHLSFETRKGKNKSAIGDKRSANTFRLLHGLPLLPSTTSKKE
jgi:hypothetical protein